MELFEYENLIEGFVEQTKNIISGHLTGIYLHGSAVMGCFNPDKSDIDIIIVVNDPLTDEIKKSFMDMVAEYNGSASAKGIELSVVTKDVCNPFIYPTPYELHFSIRHLSWYRDDPYGYINSMKGTDKDLAAHFMIIKRRGICLYGLPVDEVFAEVPRCDYMDAIMYDIGDAQKEIAENTMYLTLNLARVLAFKRDDLVLSKKEGGEWALNNLPGEYHSLIRDALSEYTASAEPSYDPVLAEKYAEYMTGLIKR